MTLTWLSLAKRGRSCSRVAGGPRKCSTEPQNVRESPTTLLDASRPQRNEGKSAEEGEADGEFGACSLPHLSALTIRLQEGAIGLSVSSPACSSWTIRPPSTLSLCRPSLLCLPVLWVQCSSIQLSLVSRPSRSRLPLGYRRTAATAQPSRLSSISTRLTDHTPT